jgi:hypothetical protein
MVGYGQAQKWRRKWLGSPDVNGSGRNAVGIISTAWTIVCKNRARSIVRATQKPKPHLKKLPEQEATLVAQHPQSQIEVWAFDEHRLGLKPILRRIWAKRGQRVIAPIEPHYQWTYLYGFVQPKTGETVWLILPYVNVTCFNQALLLFAQQVGAGPDKQILLVIDGAGWHRSGDLVIPEGIHLEFLPAYSPELQPAERLWRLADEPLVNQAFDSLDALEDKLEKRCCTLMTMQSEIKALTNFHWWPP